MYTFLSTLEKKKRPGTSSSDPAWDHWLHCSYLILLPYQKQAALSVNLQEPGDVGALFPTDSSHIPALPPELWLCCKLAAEFT